MPDVRALGSSTAELDLGGVPACGFTFFVGSTDELAIYDHVLTPARIAVHHDLGLSGPQPLEQGEARPRGLTARVTDPSG